MQRILDWLIMTVHCYKMTKIMVSSSWQWVSESSLVLRGFLEKLIKNRKRSSSCLVVQVCILGENCAYASLLRTLAGLSFKQFNCSRSSYFSRQKCVLLAIDELWSDLMTMNPPCSYAREERGENRPSVSVRKRKEEEGAGVCVTKGLWQMATHFI